MAYKVQFRLDEDILYFEIAGSICDHIDSIAAYVRYRISESIIQNVLLDLRNATGRPNPAKVFTHVLKYPPMHHINCALINREHNRDFLLLYAKLMRHRGHRIQLFASIDEGTAWLLTGQESFRRRNSGPSEPQTHISKESGPYPRTLLIALNFPSSCILSVKGMFRRQQKPHPEAS